MKDPEATLRMLQEQAAAERLANSKLPDWLKENDNMADDKSKVGLQDRQRISLSEDYEVRDWAKSLGVTEDELREAVAAVGDQVEKVREYLKK